MKAEELRTKGYEVTVMKEIMNRAGLAGGPLRPTLSGLRSEEMAEVESLMKCWSAFLPPEVLVS